VKRSLLALTVAGTVRFLRDALETIEDPLDVLVVDDASPNELRIPELCERYSARLITKNYPRGLTDSWNRVYQFFVENDYDHCILSNDDVRFVRGFSKDLLEGLEFFDIVCPVSNKPTGKEDRFEDQWLSKYCDIHASPRKRSRLEVQQFLVKKHRGGAFVPVRYFNGFCFAFSKSIERFRYSGSCLFNPSRINTKNEIELGARIRRRGGKIAVCVTSYVFHWKAGTFRELGLLGKKDRLWTDSPLFRGTDEI